MTSAISVHGSTAVGFGRIEYHGGISWGEKLLTSLQSGSREKKEGIRDEISPIGVTPSFPKSSTSEHC